MTDQPIKHPENFKIIFMGTPEFAVPSLKALIESKYNVIAVITQPDRPKGRGRKLFASPVKQIALDYGIEVLQPERVSTPEFCSEIHRRGPDLVIVTAFGQILKKEFLDIPQWGVINIHASLLPKYRGAAPIHCAILNDEDKTGLTAMKMDTGLDTGPILLQEELSIAPDETAGQLHDRLADLSGRFMIQCMNALEDDRLVETPQDEKSATYASKIDKQMSRVNWDQSAEQISAFIRALDPWPGAFTTCKNKKIKLFSSQVKDEDSDGGGIPGRVKGVTEGSLKVEAGRGIVQIRELQAPGKKRLPAEDFLRGFPIKEKTVLV